MLSTLDWVFLLLFLAIAVFFYYSKKSLARLNNALLENADAPLFQSQFKCVVVNSTALSCQMARDLQSKALLIENAPHLPLEGCNATQCHCSFIHRNDRRTGIDRRTNEDPKRTKIYENKRIFKDRRRDSIREFLMPQTRSYR
jgi:hypothetical protein